MFKAFRSVFGNREPAPEQASLRHVPPPVELRLGASEPFQFGEHVSCHSGFAFVDWEAVIRWVDSQHSEQARADAWGLSEAAWLLHMREALGDAYSLIQSGTAALISPLEPKLASATLEYLNRTLERVTGVLDGIACTGPGKDILIVFDSEDQYYEYISHACPDEGEFALSSGTFLPGPCSHFVTVQAELRSVEPVIAHEMTHACLAHLPIPLWLNEGLAVNTEHRLTGARPFGPYNAREMHAKHREFWGVEEIQQFWSGESFSRHDDGNMLSYDLARILVQHFAKDWPAFRDFVLSAHHGDGGADAARRYLGVSLGECVSMLFELENSTELEPEGQAQLEGTGARSAFP